MGEIFTFTEFDIGPLQWAVIALSAVMIGITKTGLPGIGKW